jgi:diguanylate cyclase (GGDEF)-like protein
VSATHEDVLAAVVAATRETLRRGRRPPLSDELATDADFTALLDDLVDLCRFARALSQGDLDEALSRKGAMAGAMKALQASLRHLTWQTGQVAAGDFSQRVDFMGEFSHAFNTMVVALETAHDELERRNEELRRLAAQLEQLASTDQLTGTTNRRKFDDTIAEELRRAERYAQPLSLLLFDIDHFKKVNDEHGHKVGDSVLVETTALVLQMLRSSDCLARWGGEEFVVLAPGIGPAGAATLAERIRAGVAAHVFPSAGRVTISTGVAESRPGDSPDGLLARADAAMYAAKAGGRNRVEVSPALPGAVRSTHERAAH